MMPQQVLDERLVSTTTKVVAAFVSSNTIALGEVPKLIMDVHGAFAATAMRGQKEASHSTLVPAVPIRSSIKADYIVCLEDGKKLKTLKRYLMRRFKMTPADYRKKWSLPADYPMVAPSYTEQRRAIAKSFGLGKSTKKDRS